MQRRATENGTTAMGQIQPRTHQADDTDSLLVTNPDTRTRAFAVLDLILFKFELFQDLVSQETSKIRIRLGEVPRIKVGTSGPVA